MDKKNQAALNTQPMYISKLHYTSIIYVIGSQLPIMLPVNQLCSWLPIMLLAINYAQNYASIIGKGLFTSLFRPDPLPSRELETNTSMLQRFTAESSRELSALRKLNNKQRQMSMFLILLFKLLTQLPFVSFLFSLLPFSILSLLPLPHPFFFF